MSERPLPTLLDPAGNAHSLSGEEMGIGRAIENEIVITSNRVSREHARIYRDGWKVMLADLGSKNGTFLNDERLMEPRQLQEGDRIKVGDVIFLFQDPDSTVQDSPLPELDINEAVAEVRVNRQLVSLAPKEFALVNYLFQNSDRICSKDEIGLAVWPEYQDGVYDYQVENLIRRLRTKLEPDPRNPQLLLTIRGHGYRLFQR